MEVSIGDTNYPIVESVIFFFLIASLVVTTFLFKRGEGNYSIKYEIMRQQEFFRKHIFLTHCIEIIYKTCFILPFLFLIALSVLAAIRSPTNLAPILINGLIIILLLYPTKIEHYYYKLAGIWILVFGSQLSTFFIFEKHDVEAYYVLSVIFYTANVLFFYLALVAIEGDYWEISEGIEAISEHSKELQEVNELWIRSKPKTDKEEESEQSMIEKSLKHEIESNEPNENAYRESLNLPQVFDGGLYGYIHKKGIPYKIFTILYIISLIFLAVYAFLVKFYIKSNLGFVGLVSAIIYDIFVQIFNSLNTSGRSLKSVFIVLVASRILSFAFGIQLWLLGYCVLYFGVAIFIGWIVMDKHFPLKQPVQREVAKRKILNALKTPEFAIFALTVEIIIMILVESFAITDNEPTIKYNNVNIPIWQWGILAIIAAWVVNIYMLSVRVLTRHKRKIFMLTEYYFGFAGISEYHIYILTSYVLLIALGLYAFLYLGESIVLVSVIFLPLIYMCLFGIANAFINNQYDILANIYEYNIVMKKKHEAKQRKLKIAQESKFKEKKKMMMTTFTKKKDSLIDEKEEGHNKEKDHELGSSSTFNRKALNKKEEKNKKKKEKEKEIFVYEDYKPLIDWRSSDENVKFTEIWSCFTPNDKKIVCFIAAFLILSVAYCLVSMLWCNDKFAISVMVCVICYLTLASYYKFINTKENMLTEEIIGNWIGFIIGIIYWSVFNSEVVGPIAYSIVYLIFALYLLINCYKVGFQLKVTISPTIQIVLCIIFIEITLAVQHKTIEAAVFGLVFFILLVLQVPLFFKMTKEYIPKVVIAMSVILISGAVIGISVAGYVTGFLSSFSIFSIIMVLILIAFLSASIALYLYKVNNEDENPNVYSAYGQPHYRFESAKEVLKSNTNHLVLFSFSMTTIVIFSVVVSVFFKEKEFAVFGLSLFWLLEFFVSLQVAMDSYLFIGVAKRKGYLHDEDIILRSFKQVKVYMAEEIEGEDSPHFEKKLENAKNEVLKNEDESKSGDLWKEVVRCHDQLVKNLKEEEMFLFFWIGLIIFNLRAKKKEIITKVLAELNEVEDELEESGIILEALDLALKPEEKYEKVLKEIDDLDPMDFIIYEGVLDFHRAETEARNREAIEISKKEKKEQEKRDKELFEKMQDEERSRLLEEEKERLEEEERIQSENKQKKNKNKKESEIKKQPTKTKSRSEVEIEKFKKLLADLNKKELFVDQEFPLEIHDNFKKYVRSWRRPSPSEVFVKNGITAKDVKQGKIGDCYLISTFAVLGEKRVNEIFGTDVDGTLKWSNEKGAYMIRLFKFSKEVFVIVDDSIPIDDNGEWVFARSEEPIEFWPCILEKAYAKMYGGYDKIVEGKCHQVMAEFTGGFPFEITLEDYRSNANGLWTRIISSINHGYLLAAGSPPSKGGDSVVSKRGINQGHAFSVLDAKEVDDNKLIKLKNPHGKEGQEWKGDFSDKSKLLTKRICAFLEYEPEDDGIFWMPIQDFLIEFKSLYICSVFDNRWKKFETINGKWIKGENSFGTPNFPDSEKNLHYGFQVTKKCTVFVSLSQEPKSSLKGINNIYMKAVKNGGKRIMIGTFSPENSIGKSKPPTDAVTISTELELEADEYPYVFSLLLSCTETVEGKQEPASGVFTLEAYCDDKDAIMIDDGQFDRKE